MKSWMRVLNANYHFKHPHCQRSVDICKFLCWQCILFVTLLKQTNQRQTIIIIFKIQLYLIILSDLWLAKKSTSAHAKLENMLRFAMQMFSQLRWCLFTAAASLSLLRILLTWSDKHIVDTGTQLIPVMQHREIEECDDIYLFRFLGSGVVIFSQFSHAWWYPNNA